MKVVPTSPAGRPALSYQREGEMSVPHEEERRWMERREFWIGSTIRVDRRSGRDRRDLRRGETERRAPQERRRGERRAGGDGKGVGDGGG